MSSSRQPPPSAAASVFVSVRPTGMRGVVTIDVYDCGPTTLTNDEVVKVLRSAANRVDAATQGDDPGDSGGAGE